MFFQYVLMKEPAAIPDRVARHYTGGNATIVPLVAPSSRAGLTLRQPDTVRLLDGLSLGAVDILYLDTEDDGSHASFVGEVAKRFGGLLPRAPRRPCLLVLWPERASGWLIDRVPDDDRIEPLLVDVVRCFRNPSPAAALSILERKWRLRAFLFEQVDLVAELASRLWRLGTAEEKTGDPAANLPRLFISHSSRDAGFVGLLVDLLKAGLPLTDREIRCSSLDQNALPAGTDIDRRLRREIVGCDALIGVVSAVSVASSWVPFEWGARWAGGRPLVPLLAPGASPGLLNEAPLGGRMALRSDLPGQLQRLVEDLGEALELPAAPAERYRRQVERILQL